MSCTQPTIPLTASTYCATHRIVHAGTACPQCAAADARDRFNLQHALIMDHHDAIVDLKQAEDRQDQALTEIESAVADWEEAHNRAVAYAESIERRIADLEHRAAGAEDLLLQMTDRLSTLAARFYRANGGS